MPIDSGLNPFFRNFRDGPFPAFRKPAIRGCHSLDSNRKYLHTRENLKFLMLPKKRDIHFDLNTGYSSYVPLVKDNEKLRNLLLFIEAEFKNLSVNGRLPYNFVSYRGLLTQILCSPYFSRETWCILATKYKGTIYLLQQETEEHRRYNENQSDYAKICCYNGRKFEQFVFADKPGEQPDPSKPMDEGAEFNVAFETRIGNNLKLFYTAEVDGIEQLDTYDENTPLQDLSFVEAKTKKLELTEKDNFNFLKYKLPKWWCQSFLVGVEKIVYGSRNTEGYVNRVEILPVNEIPRMCKKWSPSILMHFCLDFLTMVSDVLEATDCPYTVYKFDYESSVNPNITYEMFEGKNDLSFLSEGYINLFKT